MSDTAGKPQLHELENCWCSWHHEMKLASDLGWDTSWIGDRPIMTTDEPAGETSEEGGH